jgi:signal transduction histidine kinase
MMLTNPTKNPIARYGLIVFLLAALLICMQCGYIYSDKPFVQHLIVRLSTIVTGLLSFMLVYTLQEIYRYERRLLKFLATISHEIRSPLNSVIGFAEQLDRTSLKEHQTIQLAGIRSSATMLLDLVNEVLDFAKYRSAQVQLAKKAFHPFAILRDVIQIISNQAAQKGIELNCQISFREELCVLGDPVRLRQVLMNLLGNAVKFTADGSVALKAGVILGENREALLTVEVIDTGIGIDVKNLMMIFEEFSQVSSDYFGAGLGLHICKKIVEAQGGDIEVSSELGKGTIFRFSLPYEHYEFKTLSALIMTRLAGKRILFVDDNELNILLAKAVLAKHRMLVDIAHDGSEGFELFLKHPYDLILTDIQMPVMNGVDLTIAIRLHADALKSNIPILGVTASVLPDDQQEYLVAGMNDLVFKPFSERELIAKIAAQLI